MKTGAYQQPLYIQNDMIQEYTARTGKHPTGDDLAQITEQANAIANSPVQSALRGLKKMLSGQPFESGAKSLVLGTHARHYGSAGWWR